MASLNKWPQRDAVVTGSSNPVRMLVGRRERLCLFLMILFNYFFLAKSCPLPEPGSPQAIEEFVESKRQEVSKQNRALTLQVLLWALDWVRGQLVEDLGPEG